MSQRTLASYRADILARPGFRLFADSSTLADEVDRAINVAVQEYYETKFLTSGRYEQVTATAGLVIPAGVNWGANGKLYEMTVSTTDPLPDNIEFIKSLWIKNNTDLITYSSSTYDSDSAEGTGIPDASDDDSLAVTSVFHELSEGDDGVKLRLFIGSTACGTTPKLHLKYVREPHDLSADGDKIDVLDSEFLGTFEPMVDRNLIRFIGFDGN